LIIHINGYPGVGKLTIGRILADRLNGKLLDNHSIYNVALALTQFKSPAYYDTLRAVRTIAYQRVLELPATIPVILTNAHGSESEWGNECWDAAIELARARRSKLFIVVLLCTPEENARRIQGPDRDLKRKPRDPNMFHGNALGRPLLDRGGDYLLRLDVTSLGADEAAQAIQAWVTEQISED
jgi:hypothetical protein